MYQASSGSIEQSFHRMLNHPSTTSSTTTILIIEGHKFRKKLDGQGRARREAARRPKSECKVNLDILNSSRSSASRRLQKLYPRTTRM